jgi:polysaccharide export outer membrane protein
MYFRASGRSIGAISISLAFACTVGSLPASAQSEYPRPEDRDQVGGGSSGNSQQQRPGRTFGPTSVDEAGANPSIIINNDQLSEDDDGQNSLLDRNRRQLQPAEPGEFQDYVERVLGRELPIFGADLILPENRDFAVPATAVVPPDYRLNVGDTVSISMSGAVEGSVERTIDSNGNIFLPSVGTIHLAGVRHGDLRSFMANAIGTQYRNFRVGVRVAELRGIRVYVAGFANNPGAYSVGSLSSVANAVFQAGGPSSGGSMRLVKLIRDGREVGQFDLYDLIRGGNRVNDFVLENEDVLLIPPVGRQVAAFGSVNQEAIFELLADETLADIVDLAGGSAAWEILRA